MKIEGDWVYFEKHEAAPFEPKQDGDQYWSGDTWHDYRGDISSRLYGRFSQCVCDKFRRPLSNYTPSSPPTYDHYL